VALAIHKRALEEDPNSDWDLYNYGVALVEMWRAKEAIPVLRKAVELSPKKGNCSGVGQTGGLPHT